MKKKNTYLIISIVYGLMLACSTRCHAQTTGEVTQQLSFQEYLNRVGKKNLGYLSEKYNVSIAEAEVVASKVLPDPNLTLEAGNETFTLGMEYTLELGNKRGARLRTAKSQAQLEALALEYYFQELRAEAALLYLEAIKQKELLEVKRESYNYMLQLSQTDSIRYQLGEITATDARQSKLEAATLLNEVFDQEAEFQSALVALHLMMGENMEELSSPTGKWEEADRDYTLSELIVTGMNQRADLFAAYKQVEVATNRHRQVKAERRTELGLSINYERDWHGFMPQKGSVTGGVSIPLKLSNLNRGEVRAAKYGIEQSKLQLQEMELQVESDISQAYFFFEAAKKKVKQYESGLLDESEKILEGMVYMYKRGETGITEVLVAQRTYNEVREDYLETMKGYAAALVDLQKTCGIWDVAF